MTVLAKLLQPVWEVSSDPIVITGGEPSSDERRIVYVNGAFSRITGYSSGEAIGRPLGFLHGAKTDPNSLRVSEEQLREGKSQEFGLTQYRKDRSAFECTVTRAPLVDVDGTSEYIIAMWRMPSESNPMAAPDSAKQHGVVPLTLPMPLHKLPAASQPRHLTSHPELDALMTLWLEVCGTRALPDRREFDLNIMRRWAPHLSIAVVTTEGRFQFRLFGTKLADVYGRDLTGCFLDELTPHDLWSVVIQHYREVARTRQPLFAPISVSNGQWYTEVSRLLLPLSGSEEVKFVMGADYKRERL